MRVVGRRIKKILFWGFLLILLLIGMGAILVNTTWGQNQLVRAVTNKLSKDLQVEVYIDNVEVNLINDFIINGLYIEDQKGDTLLYVERLLGKINYLKVTQKEISFSELFAKKPIFNLRKYGGDSTYNINFIVEKYFTKQVEESKKWTVGVGSITVEDGTFSRNDNNKVALNSFDANHLLMHKVNTKISGISTKDYQIDLRLESLRFQEKSGLVVKSTSSNISLSKTDINLEDFQVVTANSLISFDGKLAYPSGEYFTNFKSDVKIIGNLKQGSTIGAKDLQCFATGWGRSNEELHVSGKITGTVDRLKGKELEMSFGNRSRFKGNMSFDGIPGLKKTFINFKVKELVTDYSDIQDLDLPFLKKIKEALPAKLSVLGFIRFDGSFTGFLNDFVAYGNFRTDLGVINSNLALIRRPSDNLYRIKGRASTKSFNLKDYMDSDNWGVIAANLKLDAKGETLKQLSADLQGSVDLVEYKGYKYENLKINGFLDNDLFAGELSSNEENLAFDFTGTINLKDKIPEYDFNLSLLHANPVALHLSKFENWKDISGDIRTTMRGNSLDNLEGQAVIKNMSFVAKMDTVSFDSLTVYATTINKTSREIVLNSEVADVKLSGNYKSKNVIPSLKNILQDIMPAWYEEEYEVLEPINLIAEVTIKKANTLLDVMAPGLSISSGTRFTGEIDPYQKNFSLSGFSDSLSFNKIKLYDLTLSAERYSDRAYLMFENKETVISEKVGFKDNIYTAYMYNDSLESDLTWSTDNLNSSGFFSTLTVFDSLTTGTLNFMPSDVVINENYWSIAENYPIHFSGKEIDIQNFEIASGIEKLIMSGDVSADPSKCLNFNFANFELHHLEGLVSSDRFKIDGIANLQFAISDIYGNPGIESVLTINDIILMDREMGDLIAKSTWNGGQKSLGVTGQLTKDGREILDLNGEYRPKAEVNKLEAILTVDELDLGILELTDAKGISNFGGTASGTLNVDGHFTRPAVTGKLNLTDATVKIDYLNTTYKFSDEVIVKKDWMGIDYTEVYDELGNVAYVNGTVGHNNFRDWNYDFSADFENLLCFNLDKKMNELFYGRGFVKGIASVSGFNSNISIEVEATSNKGTSINIPLGEEGDVKMENFITFVDPNTIKEERSTDLTGLDLNLNLDITRDAFIRLIFDEQIGDVIEGRGNGPITMDIDSRGDFNMIGNYTIEEGDYLFTLKNIVNKRFEVQKGGTITWFGDPFEALIDIEAMYKVRASLSEFAVEIPEITQRNVMTFCNMKLKNRLLNPDIEFEIELPTLAPDVRNLVSSRVNSELELNRQFFSLLVLNKFLPSQNSTSTTAFSAIDAGVNTGFEFLANQLSNWLSQISTDFDVGLNYRPGDQISNTELAVALSTQLFNERLLVSGNLGVSEGNTLTGNKSALIGDFILEYMLTEEGKLRLKVFNETNDFNIANTDQYGTTQGIGVVVFREFDPLIK
ncbi:MAG: hypothetical protein ACI8XB_000952 [Patiriisocius sp.]